MSFFNLGKKISNLTTALSKSSLGSGSGQLKAGERALYLTPPYVNASLTTGNLKNIVAWPQHLRADLNEWLAVCGRPIFDFFHNINTFYGVLVDTCTTQTCPTMSAGTGTEYQWMDAQKKTFKTSAPEYVDYVMTWVQSQLDDESVFPMKAGTDFPRDFCATTVKPIMRQLLRVFAHIYHHHYEMVLHLEAEAHLNTLFAHFVSFAAEYELVERKELQPMQELIDEFAIMTKA